MEARTIERSGAGGLRLREVHNRRELRQAAEELGDESGAALVLAGNGKVLAALSRAAEAWLGQRRRLDELVAALMPRFEELPGEDAVLQARRNAEARRELLEDFGALTSAGVAELAGSRAGNRAALANRWRKEGRVFAVRVDDELLYPLFQLSDEGRPLPAVADAVRALRGDGDLSDWQVALWFTTANGWLGGRRPVDLLEEDPEVVAEAARREVEELVS